MTKRIYKLHWRRPFANPSTEYYGQIVVADNVPEARRLATREAIDKRWLDTRFVSCKRLGTTMPGDDRSRVVLIS